MYLISIFTVFISIIFTVISYYFIKKYHQKKLLFLEKEIRKTHQTIIEKQYLIESKQTELITLQEEVISLRSELANSNIILLQKEKEITSLRILIEDLKKRTDSKNDDIFIEFPVKPSP
ncbi:hypothetical protein JYB64_08765 [Algoriphagus aestuarii]|nr:hypothetical protein [Algoriphagus aestuarii]